MFPRRLFTQLLSLFLFTNALVFPAASFGAEADFYTFNERWNKSNLGPKTNKTTALEEGFSTAISSQNTLFLIPGAPPPPVVRRTLGEIISVGGTVEIELNQTLLVEQIGGLIKFVTTDEGIATLENVNSEILKIMGTGIGSTFVHIWNAAGRNTFALRVLPPKLVTSQYQLRQLEAFEKNRAFRFGYDNARTASYTGDTFRTMQRSSVDFTQNFRLEGDTPYGALSGHMQTQKAVGKTLLSDAQVVLNDGKMGAYKNFNATIGDTQVKPDLMVFPGARIRGAEVEHWDDAKRVSWSAFHGRENSSIIGTLTPGVLSKRTLNSYLSGGVMDFKVNDNAKLKAGYFSGSGRSRADNLNRRGFGAQTEVNLGEHALLKNETDFDNEEFAHKHAVTAMFDKLRVRDEFRDVNRKFQTLIGAPSRQGEVGNLLEINAEPLEHWAASGSLDIFRDRLIPNPQKPDAANVHTDLLLTWSPYDEVSWTFNFQDLDDTGRLGPTRQRMFGTQYNEHFDIWGHKATLFTRYQYRVNHLLTSSLNDTRQNQVILGLYTRLFWDINFSVQKEWNALEEVEISRYTHPSALVYSWDYSHQIGNSPFFMETRLRIRDEEQTESSNSFMAGEDSTEFSSGIYYREFEDMEFFLTGSATQYVAESLNVASPRVDAQFYTGMRCNFDTGYRWGAVGSFEGYVFKDQNGDGTRQPYEPGLAGLLVTTTDGKQALTDEKGYYQIKGVSGKKVTLTLDSSKIPYGFAPTSALTQQVDIVQNKTIKIDFSLTPRSEVTGIIFNDLNKNGKYDLTDAGVGKVKITLENAVSARSNNLGVYSFPNVVAGEHTASLVLSTLPEGYLPLNVPKKNFTLYEGIRYELNFPLRAARALTGRVFLDENRNNALDANETALSDIPVLFAGQSVVSDKEGWYLFDNLNQGLFELTVDHSRLPVGFVAPAPVKIEIPSGAITMSDIHIPLSVNPKAKSQTEDTVYVKSAT